MQINRLGNSEEFPINLLCRAFKNGSLHINRLKFISLFISKTHTNDMLIYVTPTRYNTVPYSSFRADICISEVMRNNVILYID